MDSDSVVDKILKEDNALRLIEEQSGKQGEPDPTAPTPPTNAESAARDDGDTEAQRAMAAQRLEMERMPGVKEGTIIEGTVVHIDPDGVLVDVGGKSEGLIRPQEFVADELASLKVGDSIWVFVISADDEEGSLQLSKKKADYEITWQRILESYEKSEVVQCTVTDRVKGGLRVDLGIMGFIPASHVGVRNPNELDRFVGEVVNAKIIEVDRARKKVILSRRIAEKEVREQKRSDILGTLKEGQVREGVVRNITSYGAFVDLGGVDGLLHITEMSWVHINKPSEVVQTGDKIQVMVLKIDPEKDRISLGLKQLQPDPWDTVGRNYRVGQVLEVTVSRCVASGAFVKLPEGVEAFIPIREMASGRIDRPEDVIRAGQLIQAKVINLQPKQRRMSLSLVQAVEDAEREETRRFMGDMAASSTVTIGDQFGHLLQQVVRPEGAAPVGTEPVTGIEPSSPTVEPTGDA